MKKAILSLFIAFSLFVAPVAHAVDFQCESGNCQLSEQVKKEADGTQQDNDKMAKVGHHCCSHVLTLPGLILNKSTSGVASRTPFILEQDTITSVVVGPPLKPPSNA